MKRSEIYGDSLVTMREVLGSFICDNWNVLDTLKTRNQIMLMAQKFAQILEDDRYSGTECITQWELPPHKSQLEELFRLDTEINVVATQNVHEYDNREQEGGTWILSFDTIES